MYDQNNSATKIIDDDQKSEPKRCLHLSLFKRSHKVKVYLDASLKRIRLYKMQATTQRCMPKQPVK